MRSNGAVHLNNNTFVMGLTNQPNNLFIITRDFKPDYIQELPGDLPVDLGILPSLTSPTPDEAIKAAHHLVSSPDGRYLAAISTARHQHYLLYLSHDPITVALLETKELVRSAQWLPDPNAVPCLVLLLASGVMHLYDVRFHLLGVLLPRAKEFNLFDYLPPKAFYPGETPSSKDPRPSIRENTNVALAPTRKETLAVMDHPDKQPRNASKPLGKRDVFGIRESVPFRDGDDNDKEEERISAPIDDQKGLLVVYDEKTNGKVMTSSDKGALTDLSIDPKDKVQGTAHLRTVIPQPPPGPELLRIKYVESEDGKGYSFVSVVAPMPQTFADNAPRPDSDLVEICLIPPSSSIAHGILATLTTAGAVYSAAISEHGIPRTDLKDGSLDSRPLLTGVMCTAVSPSSKEGEIALSFTCTLIDAENELYAVITLFNSGVVRVAHVRESILVALPSRGPSVSTPSYTVEVHLGGPIDIHTFLSPLIPSSTHLVQLERRDNVCLTRYDDSGFVYMIVLPVWSPRHAGWTYDYSLVNNKKKHKKGPSTFPPGVLISHDAEVPAPLSIRLPFPTTNKSISLGDGQILIAPSDSSTKGMNLVILDVPGLIRTALYASIDKVQRHSGWEGKEDQERDKAWKQLDDGYEEMLSCQHSFFVETPDETNRKLDSCFSQLHHTHQTVKQCERSVNEKKAKLLAAIDKLQWEVSQVREGVVHDREVLLNAIAHRRGRRSVEVANEKLSEIHKVLNETEHILHL